MTRDEAKALVAGYIKRTLYNQAALMANISRYPRSELLSHLVPLTYDDNEEIRYLSLELAFRLGPQSVLGRVRELLGSSLPDDRRAVYITLRDNPLKSDPHRRVFADLMVAASRHEPVAEERYYAVWALGSLGDMTDLPVLNEIARVDDGTDFEGRPISELAMEAVTAITRRRAGGTGNLPASDRPVD
jgi:hypothetical protein